MQGVADPLEWGVVDNYAHPGGNITGTAFDNTDEAIKRVELFRDAFPAIDHVIVVGIYSTTITTRLEEIRRAGDKLGVAVDIPFTDTPDKLERALDMARGAGIVVGGSVSLDTSRVIEFASASRIPAIFARSENVTAGGLMSFGGDRRELRFAVGRFVKEIVAGAAPGDIPVLFTNRFDLLLNQGVAERSGFTLPRSVLARVNEVVH
jgi:putative ABC transport system substrate-binding protein